jgi:hypothetical protein
MPGIVKVFSKNSQYRSYGRILFRKSNQTVMIGRVVDVDYNYDPIFIFWSISQILNKDENIISDIVYYMLKTAALDLSDNSAKFKRFYIIISLLLFSSLSYFIRLNFPPPVYYIIIISLLLFSSLSYFIRQMTLRNMKPVSQMDKNSFRVHRRQKYENIF